MNQATNVNIVPSYGQRGDLHFSQYDVGRTATINLYAVNEAYTIPVGATVKIQATKPSGLGFDVVCTFSGSVVTVVSTSTMTEEAGRFPAELHIVDNNDIIGTANFMFCVEPSPHPDGTIDGDADYIINEIEALVLKSEGYALGTQNGVPVTSGSPYYENNSKWYSEHPTGGGLTEEVKQALLDCFENVAWIGADGQDYYDALYDALYPAKTLVSISAVYTQSGTVYETDPLDSLKTDLVVTATYDDSSTETVTTYTLSGTLEVGTSTITVTYLGKTTTFNVTVSQTTLLYYWDFTGENPLIDKVSSKVATESGTVTYDSGGVTFGTASSCIVLADLTSSYLSDKTVEIEFGDMISTGNSSSHQRVFTFGNTYGLICRKDDHKWNIYGTLSGTATWQPSTAAQNDVANKIVKIEFNGLTDLDVYLDGNLILEDASMDNSASSGNVRLGATSNSNVIVKIKALKVY